MKTSEEPDADVNVPDEIEKVSSDNLEEANADGVSLEDREFLKSIAARDPLANLVRKPQDKVSKVAGARYERVWKGKKYEVTVLGEKRFEFAGEVYTSLSAVARAITGTRWNGKVFFGVK